VGHETDPPDGVVNSVVGDVSGTVVQAGTVLGGIHIGSVNLVTGVPVRTRYQLQVERIAPPREPGLLGRAAELAELAAFCSDPSTSGTCRWWRAAPWSGKTALMSWFVLHPPAGVRIVSFFVTARWASQNDRAAFIDNVLEQLLALLGRPLPPLLTESTRETHLLGLLDEAAAACHHRGESLVLLVDGLDEDHGAHDGPDAHSIAALLPATPPAGLRIIIAGRPNPPIPVDVPADHPLRDPAVIRPLARSPQARTIQVEAERELKRLLHATTAEQDLLGLLAAAGGGLSAVDLAELTGGSVWEVRDRLTTVTGRSFSYRASRFRPGTAPEVYLLGHEELQLTALAMLGPARLAGYRERLHDWAARHRSNRWPADTPEYLLSGYFRMLHATGDLARMVVYATDRDRQNRMLNLTGGDAIALSDIGTTYDVIAAHDRPDLCALVRLTIHRDHLTNRNSDLPDLLPAAWARLGHADRAESIARSIVAPAKRIKVLTSMATATDDRDRAARLLDEAELIAHTLDEREQADALERTVRALAATGAVDRAESVADTITDDDSRALALAQVARVAMRTGDVDRAERIIGRLPPSADVLKPVAEADEVDHAERIARTITQPRWRRLALVRTAEAAAQAGDVDRAERMARDPELGPLRAEALARVAYAVAAAGDPERASTLLDDAMRFTRAISEPRDLEDALGSVAQSLARAGDVDRAERIVHTIDHTDPTRRTDTLTRVATAAAEAGAVDHAERIARTITQPGSLAAALTSLAGAVTEPGRATRLLDDAERSARTGTVRHTSWQAVARVAGKIAETGDLDRAEHIAHTIATDQWQAAALAWTARAAAEAGDTERAERIIDTITDDDWREEARAVEAPARTVSSADLDRLERLVMARPSDSYGLLRFVETAARAGEIDRAERIARTITSDQHDGAKALAAVARYSPDERTKQALVVDLLRLDDWQFAVDVLAELDSATLDVIGYELAGVTQT
jgi:tetratricopeptide (TPR) repeat protein